MATAAWTRLKGLRTALRSSPVLRRAARHRLGAGILVLATVVTVQMTIRSADRVRADWGETREVIVVTRAIGSGQRIDSASVMVQRHPVGALPRATLRQLGDTDRATVDLLPGEVLTPPRIDHSRRSAAAAALPTGTVGVSVQAGTAAPTAEVGDRVDVVRPESGYLDRSFGSPQAGSGGGYRVADSAVVVRIREDQVLLAVRRDQADATAAAALAGPLALVLRP